MNSGTPLTNKALERLRGVVAGNGIDPQTVKIAKTDEAVYTVNAELQMSARWELELAKPAELKQQQPRPVNTTQELHAVANGRPFPDKWWETALEEIKANNVGAGSGWGADGLTVALPALTELFVVNEICNTCAGQKYVNCSTCEGSGLEWCWHCNRSGLEPSNPQQRCSVCKGELKAECRACFGKRMVGCMACKGRGSKQTTYALRFIASTRFGWVGGADLPTALRRSIDRAGLAKLSNGHATIKRLPASEEKPINPVAPVLPFTATLPFASCTFDISGKPFTAELLGDRTAILEMKPFLDQIVANAISSAKLHELRLYKEAQKIAGQRGKVTDFTRGYPVGLSREMAEKVFQIARASLDDLLTKPRRQALLIAGAVGVITSAAYFYGPLGLWMVYTRLFGPMALDLGFPILTSIAFVFALQWWTSRKLATLLGGDARTTLVNRTALMGGLLIFAIHWLMLFTLPDMPMWYLAEKLNFDVWIQNLGREE